MLLAKISSTLKSEDLGNRSSETRNHDGITDSFGRKALLGIKHTNNANMGIFPQYGVIPS